MGSAALYFSLRPSAGLLSDINVELTDTFDAVREAPQEVYDRLASLPQCKDAYYAVRSIPPAQLDRFERAARFVYLNRFCFNGLYRTNNKGDFNVPYAGKKTPLLPDFAMFKAASDVLQQATILSGDFESVIRGNVRAGDLVYLDPPYAVANRRIFRQYGPQTFGLIDIERLQTLLSWITDQGAAFVLSYARSPEAERCFATWPVRRVVAQRNIGGFVDRRRNAVEMLVASEKYMLA